MKTYTRVGDMRHLVTVQAPTITPTTDGGFTEAWADADPAQWWCAIQPATARDMEQITSGTVLSTASHVLSGRYHAGINTKARILFNGRTLAVQGVANLEERNIETVAICAEVVV